MEEEEGTEDEKKILMKSDIDDLLLSLSIFDISLLLNDCY